MSFRNPEQINSNLTSRRKALGLIAAGTAATVSAMSKLGSVSAECVAPAAIIRNDQPQIATVNMVGERIIRQLLNGSIVDQHVVGPSDKVDLRLSLAADPENTYKYATFKTDRDILEDGWATLIGGDLYDKGNSIEGLNLYGKDISWTGNWDFNTQALVERCGIEILEDAWEVRVERAIREGSIHKFNYEFSFGVVPNCSPKRQRYLSVISQTVSQPTPTVETVPTPAPTPAVPAEHPTQIPVREVGVPTDSPAQVPLRAPGNPV